MRGIPLPKFDSTEATMYLAPLSLIGVLVNFFK